MEKWLCWGSMGISGSMLLVFVLDLALGIPFGRINFLVDLLASLASAIVLYMSWNAFQDIR